MAPRSDPTYPTFSPNHPKYTIDSSLEAYNNNMLGNVHRLLGITIGICAGVLGLSNLLGVLFYLLVSTLCNALIYVVVVQGSVTAFNNPKKIMTKGLGSEVASFLFFWTLVYNVVYVYS